MTGGKRGKGGEGDEAFDWDALVPRILHPTKVAILEALLCLGQELSATEIKKLFGQPKLDVGRISYHLNSLAKMKILVKTRRQQVRGAVEKFYFFPE